MPKEITLQPDGDGLYTYTAPPGLENDIPRGKWALPSACAVCPPSIRQECEPKLKVFPPEGRGRVLSLRAYAAGTDLCRLQPDPGDVIIVKLSPESRLRRTRSKEPRHLSLVP